MNLAIIYAPKAPEMLDLSSLITLADPDAEDAARVNAAFNGRALSPRV